MKEVIEYLIQFLLYGNEQAHQLVGYTADESEWANYRVVVVPNGHFGKTLVIPTDEELEWRCERVGETSVVYTDVVYNTFFFTSRAEELLVSQRDEYGRFLASHSLLGQKNRLMIPLVDEYSRALMKLLELPLPKPGYSKVYLTHDVDSIAHYRHLRGVVGGLLRGQWDKVLASMKDIHNDPAYTFSWLISQDKTVEGAECVYFIKDTAGKGVDYPQYDLSGKDFEGVEQLIKNSGAKMGLHSSAYGTKFTYIDVFANEMRSQGAGARIYHRGHYLATSIEDWEVYVRTNITDDFTMMFADHVGFRLQTTRAVRWINPKTWELTTLTLHPLTVMDCTLSHSHYMGMSEDEAYFHCQRLFEKIHQNAGEVVLLWHNTIINDTNYHKSLYPKILSLLAE